MADPINIRFPMPADLVFGLLEMLEDRGGREDGYKIARDLNSSSAICSR